MEFSKTEGLQPVKPIEPQKPLEIKGINTCPGIANKITEAELSLGTDGTMRALSAGEFGISSDKKPDPQKMIKDMAYGDINEAKTSLVDNKQPGKGMENPGVTADKNIVAQDGVVAQIHARLDANPALNNTLTELQNVNKKLDVLRASKNPDDQQKLAELEQKKTELTAKYNKQSEAPTQVPKPDLTQEARSTVHSPTAENKAPDEEKQTIERTMQDQKDGAISEKSENAEPKLTEKEKQVKQALEIYSKVKEINPAFNLESPEGQNFFKKLAENPEQMGTINNVLDKFGENKKGIENSEELKKLGISTSELAKAVNKAFLENFTKQLNEKIERSKQEQVSNPDPAKKEENEKDSALLGLLKALGLIALGATSIAIEGSSMILK